MGVVADNLHLYAGASRLDCSVIGPDLIQAGDLALSMGYGTARGSGTRMAPGFDTLEQFYVWLPGNLFIGPNNRSDDPGEGFENHADVVIGSQDFDRLYRTYENMILYINGNENVLSSIRTDLTAIAARRSVYTLDSTNWEYVNGKYRLRTSQNFSIKSSVQKQGSDFNYECSGYTPNYNAALDAAGLI